MAVCFSCNGDLSDLFHISRSTVCPHCGADVRVCLNCRFYDPGAHWECREDIPEEVKEKDRANFCEYFQLRSTALGEENVLGKDDQRRKQAYDDLSKLFGDE